MNSAMSEDDGGDLEPRSILVVDPDPASRQLVAAVLVPRGWLLLEATSIAEANELLTHTVIRAVMVDRLLPDGDGLDLLERLAFEVPQLIRVYYSSLALDDAQAEALVRDVGVHLVLNKPLTAKELSSRLCPLIDASVELSRPADAPGESYVAMQARRLSYDRHLPEQLSHLARLVEQAVDAGSSDALGAATRAAIRLRTSAGVNGHTEVCVLLGDVEQGLRMLGEDGADRLHVEQQLRQAGESLRTMRRVSAGAKSFAWDAAAEVGAFDELELEAGEILPLLRVAALQPTDHAWNGLQAAGARFGFQVARLDSINAPEARLADVLVFDASGGSASCASDLGRILADAALVSSSPCVVLGRRSSLSQLAGAARAGASAVIAWPTSLRQLAQELFTAADITHEARARMVAVLRDSREAATLMAELQPLGVDCTCVSDPQRLVELLDMVEPHLVLCDAHLPLLSGLDVCRVLRCSPRWGEVAVVLVADPDETGYATAALDAGVRDIVARPLLHPRGIARVQALARAALRLSAMRERDPLSGLLRPRDTWDALAWCFARSWQGRSVRMAVMDFSGFCRFTSDAGFHAGDELLWLFGRALAKHTRPAEVAGHWFGARFLFASADLPMEVLISRCEAFDRAIAALSKLRSTATTVRLSAAVFELEGGTDGLVTALEHASTHLGRAAAEGTPRAIIRRGAEGAGWTAA